MQVDCNARNEYDYINNYKVLQDVFSKLKVDKYVDVQKLIQGKPLDNIGKQAGRAGHSLLRTC